MKTLELTKEACDLLANCIIAQMEQWNKVGDNVYASEMLADARKNEIGKLKTLLDYITTDL